MTATAAWPTFEAALLGRDLVADRTMAFRFAKPADWTYRAGEFVDITLLDSNLTFVATMSDMSKSEREWGGERGRIDWSMLDRHLAGAADAIYYLTGPPGMVHGLSTMLVDSGVDEDDIRTEEFTGY